MKLKKIITSIIFILCIFTLSSNIYGDQTPKFYNHYKNVNGTYNWYLIDTLNIKDYILVRDDSYREYLISSEIKVDSLTKINLINDSNSFIVLRSLIDWWHFIYMNLGEFEEKFEKFIPENSYLWEKEIVVESNKNCPNYTILKYNKPPKFFMFFLMTGKAFNFIYFYNVCDGSLDKPYEFPDENAYYKVLMPVWVKD